MSRILGKNTKPEQKIARLLRTMGIRFERHCSDLVGRPDFVVRQARIVIFVDGDFWHGYRFPRWKDKLSPKWEQKIEANRERDRKNHRRLRYKGWIVVRLWEHMIETDIGQCEAAICSALSRRQGRNP